MITKLPEHAGALEAQTLRLNRTLYAADKFWGEKIFPTAETFDDALTASRDRYISIAKQIPVGVQINYQLSAAYDRLKTDWVPLYFLCTSRNFIAEEAGHSAANLNAQKQFISFLTPLIDPTIMDNDARFAKARELANAIVIHAQSRHPAISAAESLRLTSEAGNISPEACSEAHLALYRASQFKETTTRRSLLSALSNVFMPTAQCTGGSLEIGTKIITIADDVARRARAGDSEEAVFAGILGQLPPQFSKWVEVARALPPIKKLQATVDEQVDDFVGNVVRTGTPSAEDLRRQDQGLIPGHRDNALAGARMPGRDMAGSMAAYAQKPAGKPAR